MTQWHIYGLLAELNRTVGRIESKVDANTQRLNRIESKRGPRRSQRAALVTALWTAAAGTAWNADSIAARILSWIER